uniref:Uncharacterized protein n=1 Tax=Heliothis virescens TaxID=7102 RepID=A0A2A4JQ48_HELVI
MSTQQCDSRVPDVRPGPSRRRSKLINCPEPRRTALACAHSTLETVMLAVQISVLGLKDAFEMLPTESPAPRSQRRHRGPPIKRPATASNGSSGSARSEHTPRIDLGRSRVPRPLLDLN